MRDITVTVWSDEHGIGKKTFTLTDAEADLWDVQGPDKDGHGTRLSTDASCYWSELFLREEAMIG